ncbi:hypothetical protein Hanom_Chr01g00016761 [Helianthus anomalus]
MIISHRTITYTKPKPQLLFCINRHQIKCSIRSSEKYTTTGNTWDLRREELDLCLFSSIVSSSISQIQQYEKLKSRLLGYHASFCHFHCLILEKTISQLRMLTNRWRLPVHGKAFLASIP